MVRNDRRKSKRQFPNRFAITLVTLLLFVISSNANAFVITEDENLEVRWDNTFRYNYGVRTENPNPKLIGNPNFDDGDRNFSKGTVTNRLDILSEFDLRFKKDYGFRVSGAGWYDQAYHDSLGNDSVATSNHIANGQQALGLSDYTKRYFAGPDAELLDAFVFGKVDLGDVPVSFKVGRHTLYWGEALLFGGAINGIAYSQMPIDAGKAFATPGAEVKELFRPLFNVSAQAQLTPSLTLAAQYFLQWEPFRVPEAGSFLNPSDIYLGGAESLIVAPGFFFKRGADVQPNGMKDWGAMAKWSPAWLNGGAFGAYYRRFSDKLPQVHLDLTRDEYFFAYADRIDLVGVSFTKQIMGVSVGLEYNYRWNMPLVSSVAYVIPGMQKPGEGDTYGARGNTQQAVINFLGLINKTPLWDTSTWAIEFTYSRWDKVTQGDQYFLGRDGYDAIDRVSKDAAGVAAFFTPTWFDAFPGMDLSMPINASVGFYGTSALNFGDNLGAGTASIGLALDVYKKYNFAITYNKYFGDYTTANGVMTANRGLQALLSDRDWVAFTFKFTL